MRAFVHAAGGLALATGLLLACITPANAQDVSVRLVVVKEEGVSAATVAQLQSSYSDERARLQVRLRAAAPNQTPGRITTTMDALVGDVIDTAMRQAVVVAPHGTPVVIGLRPQADPGRERELVLHNLTAWIEHGRRLGVKDMENVAILAESKFLGQGDTFTVEGVQYVLRVENGSLSFHRN